MTWAGCARGPGVRSAGRRWVKDDERNVERWDGSLSRSAGGGCSGMVRLTALLCGRLPAGSTLDAAKGRRKRSNCPQDAGQQAKLLVHSSSVQECVRGVGATDAI
jgi:hypothetical protein